MPEPRLHLTVSRLTWDKIARAAGADFADSYLSGAIESGSRLTTRTTVAHSRLIQNPAAMRAFSDLGLRLMCPLPVGHPDRPDTF